MSSTVSECPICYENLGKIYRTIQCGHKFHHKCLKTCELKEKNKHSCPYCRQEYENILLRNTTKDPTEKELKQRDKFILDIKKLLDECEAETEKKNKIFKIIKIYKTFTQNISILNNPKFQFNKFKVVIKSKTIGITEQINNVIEELGMNYIGKKKFDDWIYYKEKVVSKI